MSIDENTTVAELAGVLEVDGALVREAVSIYCRLGFAKKKNSEMDSNDLHPSWYDHLNGTKVSLKLTSELSLKKMGYLLGRASTGHGPDRSVSFRNGTMEKWFKNLNHGQDHSSKYRL